MRVALRWLGVAVVVVGTASACGASVDSETTKPKEILFITPSSSGSTAGGEPIAGGPAGGSSSGGSSSGGSAGVAGSPESEAGAGGGRECEGNYECPAVIFFSHAIIKVDLPISVAEAADAVFTACRNAECYSAKGSAQSLRHDDAWVASSNGSDYVSLRFDGPEQAPFAVLEWKFADFDAAPLNDDHYSLTVQRAEDEAPTPVFDEQVVYGVEVTDQYERDWRYCVHCYEVKTATVDARAEH